MGATDAERQRRYRAHKAGNHNLCSPDRECSTAPEAVTESVTESVTRNAETRGQRLWREMDGDALSGGRRALVEEACRIANRLDRLDGLINGDLESLLRFRISDDGTEVTVTVNNVLAEARQQAAVLKQIVSELRQSGAVAQQPDQEASSLDDLAKRREDRRRAAGL